MQFSCESVTHVANSSVDTVDAVSVEPRSMIRANGFDTG